MRADGLLHLVRMSGNCAEMLRIVRNKQSALILIQVLDCRLSARGKLPRYGGDRIDGFPLPGLHRATYGVEICEPLTDGIDVLFGEPQPVGMRLPAHSIEPIGFECCGVSIQIVR